MRRVIPLVLGCLGAAAGVSPALAHGVVLNYRPTNSVELEAVFDNGEPMADAQVLIYSPENPTEPWAEGRTDDQGVFLFTPDPALPGTWEVTVRQAGHGGVVTIPVEDTATADASEGSEAVAAVAPAPSETVAAAGPSPIQQGVMVGSVIWGFIGTALFFSRGKR
jgi:nickel transport protein